MVSSTVMGICERGNLATVLSVKRFVGRVLWGVLEVNCLINSSAFSFDVVAVLESNSMVLFGVRGGFLLDRPPIVFHKMWVFWR